MSIGNKIRQLRKENGLTQKQLGEKCGIAEPTIRKYELGLLNPKIETLSKIAKALNNDITVFNHDNIIYFNTNQYKSINEMTSEEIKEVIKTLPNSLETVAGLLEEFEEQLIDIYSDSKVGEDLLKIYYNKLNKKGRKEAIKRISELAQINDYIGKDETTE